MKVILLRDVAKIGRRYEIVDVPNGYALNKLIPQKLAEAATPAGLKRVAILKQKTSDQKDGQLKELEEIKEKLAGKKIVIKVEANEKGHLFKGISAKDISENAQALEVSLSEENIVIKEPIKTLGEHKVLLRVLEKEIEIDLEVVNNKSK